jgi:hypothetical protein
VKRGRQARTPTAAPPTARAGDGAHTGGGKRKRILSPEGRKAIAEAMRKRWAKAKREGKSRLS